MGKLFVLLLCLGLAGCANWKTLVFGPLIAPPQTEQQNRQYAQQQNYQSSDQNLHPDMEKHIYPPGYPIPVRGGQISCPQPDGSVIVYSPPSGGDVYNQQGQKVGTYKPR